VATFLSLCEKVARESGIVAGTQPTSVTGQSGLLLQIVNWVADSWVEIQNSRNGWKFLHSAWSGTLNAGQSVYTAASFGLTRHARWVGDDRVERTFPTTLYLQSGGVADEGPIREIPYEQWLRMYDQGSQVAARPVHYAISPVNEICFGPKPDLTYIARGRRYKSAQVLAANTDEPECPGQYHDVIVWRALMKLAGFDESASALTVARANYDVLMGQLERNQLPAPGIAATLLR